MCDCYTAHCEMCTVDMAMHIADFCTDRESVRVYCSQCAEELNMKFILGFQRAFTDRITDKQQVDGGEIGKKVLILCDDPRAYGIHLN